MERFLKRLFRRDRVRTGKRKARTIRLGIESLEERAVPAGNVADVLDVGVLAQAQRPPVLEKVDDFTVGADRPQLIAVGSFNSLVDNFPDLFVTNLDGTYTVLLGDGTGTFSFVRTQTITFEVPDPAGILSDVFITFEMPVSVGGNHPINGAVNPEGVVAADWDLDGDTDVAVASFGGGNTPGTIKILLNDGNANFTPYLSPDFSLPLPEGASPTYLSAADLDRDGKTDLVASVWMPGNFNGNPDESKGMVLIYKGLGDGNLALYDFNYATNGLDGPNQNVVADFNHDGELDIAVASKNNATVSLFQGIGEGRITSAGYVRLNSFGSVGLAAGDLDGDGWADLAVANYGSGEQGARTLSLLRNSSEFFQQTGLRMETFSATDYFEKETDFDSSIDFEEPRNLTFGSHLINVVITDFDGDGRRDMAVSSAGNTDDANSGATDKRVFLLYNQSRPGLLDFVLEEPTLIPGEYTGLNPVGLVAADLDNNGSPDLVSANEKTDDVTVWRNRTDPALFGAPVGRIDTDLIQGFSAPQTMALNLDDLQVTAVADLGLNLIAEEEGYNWGGLNEKWLDDGTNVYFITPDGSLYQWHFDSGPGYPVPLTGTPVARVDPVYWEDTKLFEADQTGLVVISADVANQAYQLDASLGLWSPGGVSLNWGGRNEKWILDADSQWYFITPDGSLYLWDGSGPDALTGLLVANLDPIHWLRPELLYDAQPTDPAAAQAYQLDGSLDLWASNLYLNWGGLNEKWMQDATNQWYFITPDGSFYRWDGSPASALTGTLVATLTPDYWARPELLYDAQLLNHRVVFLT